VSAYFPSINSTSGPDKPGISMAATVIEPHRSRNQVLLGVTAAARIAAEQPRATPATSQPYEATRRSPTAPNIDPSDAAMKPKSRPYVSSGSSTIRTSSGTAREKITGAA